MTRFLLGLLCSCDWEACVNKQPRGLPRGLANDWISRRRGAEQSLTLSIKRQFQVHSKHQHSACMPYILYG